MEGTVLTRLKAPLNVMRCLVSLSEKMRAVANERRRSVRRASLSGMSRVPGRTGIQ